MRHCIIRKQRSFHGLARFQEDTAKAVKVSLVQGRAQASFFKVEISKWDHRFIGKRRRGRSFPTFGNSQWLLFSGREHARQESVDKHIVHRFHRESSSN